LGAAELNSLSCTIKMVEYLGTICQISALLNNGLRMTARQVFKPNIGEAVSCHVPPDRLVIFPMQKAGPA
jgi:hypothetical protein